jgi:predicted DCC family thiol-disulfide oxidoreductase YuxK
VTVEPRLERAPPAPAQHPIVLFDGVCNLCSGVVAFLIRHDRASRFRFAPLQSELGRALQVRHGLDPDALDTFVLVDDAGAHARSTAVLRILRELPAPWRWLWPLVAVPRPLRDALYGFVARRRYRWFGRRDRCFVPTPELRSRFLS